MVHFTPVFGGQLLLLLDSSRNVFFCRVSGTFFRQKKLVPFKFHAKSRSTCSSGRSSCELVLDDGQTAVSQTFDFLLIRSLEVTSMKLDMNNTYEISFTPLRCEICDVYCNRGTVVWRGRHNGCSSVTCVLRPSSVVGPSSLEISFDGLLYSHSGFSAMAAGVNGSADNISSYSLPSEQLKNLTLISVFPKSFFASFFKITLTVITNEIMPAEDIQSCALGELNAKFVSSQHNQVSCTFEDTRGLKNVTVVWIALQT